MNNQLDLSILKTLITNKKYSLDFANDGDPKLFSPEVWNFANLIVSYVRTHKELPTLRVITEKLAKGNNEKLIDSVKKTWEKLDQITVDEREFKHDLEKIKRRYAEKQITSVKDTLASFDPGSMDISKAVSELQKTIQSIKGLNQVKAFERKTLKDALPAFTERFNAKRLNPNVDAGLKTGYSFIDYATNGIKPADFVIIAGESGFGKSLFLNNIAVQAWLQQNTVNDLLDFKQGKNIVYFSLEMPFEDCFNRLLSRLSGVPSRKIENASIDKDEFNKIKKVLDFINIYPYQFEIIDIADACADDLDLILEDITYNIDAVFIDYLGIMITNGADKRDEADWQRQGIISQEIRAIGRKRKLPLFSAVQLNRKASGKDPADNIGLSRLARSATIATHATTVIQIETRQQEEHYSDMIFHLIKNRKGPKGKGKLIKNLACATLIDDASGNEEVMKKMKEQETFGNPDENKDLYDKYFIDKDPDDISNVIDLFDI